MHKTELSVLLLLFLKVLIWWFFSGDSHCHTLEEGWKCYSLVFTCSSVTTNCLYLTPICKNPIFILLNQFNWETLTWDLLLCPSFNILLSWHHLTQHLGNFFLFPVAFNHLFYGSFLTCSWLMLNGSFSLVPPGLDCAHLRQVLWKDGRVKCMRTFPTTISAPV